MNDRRMLAALLGSALIGAIVGAVSAVVVVSTRAGDAPRARADGGELAGAVRALREVLDGAIGRLEDLDARASAAELAPPAVPPREPVGAGADVTALLAGLDERLERLADVLSTARGTASGRPLPGASRGAEPLPVMDVVNSRGFRDAHLFWDYGRLVEHYGLPDKAFTFEDRLQLAYGREGGTMVRFDFVDGMVVSVREY